MEYQIIGGLDAEYLEALKERFWAKVDKKAGDGCWEWTAYRSPSDYGSIIIKHPDWYHHQRAHRVAYELCVGPIPKDMFVCHTCDNPPCVNPNHLFTGTPKDNTQDMIDKGRAAPNYGRHNGNAILGPDEVKEIRRLYKPHKYGCKKLARRFGVTYQMIHRIVARKSWTHI